MNIRDEIRVKIRLKATIISDDKRFKKYKKFKTYTGNVSARGISIRDVKVFPVNTLLTIELELPSGDIVTLRGRVTRRFMIPEDDLDRNGMGIQLIDRPKSYIEFISALCSEEKNPYVKKTLSGIARIIRTKHGKIKIYD